MDGASPNVSRRFILTQVSGADSQPLLAALVNIASYCILPVCQRLGPRMALIMVTLTGLALFILHS